MQPFGRIRCEVVKNVESKLDTAISTERVIKLEETEAASSNSSMNH